MKTSITIGRKNGEWKAVILEGDGTRQGDQKTVLPLNGKHSATEKELIAQLPAKYKEMIKVNQASLVIIN